MAAIAAALAMMGLPAQADPIADFYRGKDHARMLIGYGPGGGYDIYGRLVAEFLPRHSCPAIRPILSEHAGRRQLRRRGNTCTRSRRRTAPCWAASPRRWRSTASPTPARRSTCRRCAYVGRVVSNIDTSAWRCPRAASRSFDDVRKKLFNVGASGRRLHHGAVPYRAEQACGREVQADPRLQRH